MASVLDVLITFLGISSIALLLGNQSVAVSELSLTSQTPANVKSVDVMLDFCASNLCSFESRPANTDQSVGRSINVHHAPYIFENVSSEWEAERSDMNWLADYVPPTCSDTDSDTTNNCGPNDSSDAGTRLAV